MKSDRQEEVLLQIAGAINTLICSVNSEGHLTYFNPYWEELLGWTPQELTQNPVFEFIHPDDHSVTETAINAIFVEGKKHANFRNRYRTSAGQYVWLQWFATAMESGEIGASGYVVTDLVALEQENSEKNRLLQQAFTLGLMGDWSLDYATASLTWSKEVYAIHGLIPTEYRPQLETALDFYHPEDKENISQLVQSALDDEIAWDFIGRIIRPDGEVRRVRAVAEISRDWEGKPLSIMGVVQDITEYTALNERVELLSRVAETTTAGVVITDSQRKVVWVNGSFNSMTGYSLEEVEGQSLWSILQGAETSPSTKDDLRKQLDTCSNIDVEILNYRKDGTKYWNHLIISPVMKQGKVTHYIGVQNDISQRKAQESKVAQALKLDAIGQLAAGICHDFNNIVGVVSASAELLESKNRDPNLDSYIKNITRATERATGVTARLLKITKHSAAPEQIVNIDEEMSLLTKMLIESVPNNISISCSCHSKSQILMDKNSLLDAVMNIVINAQQSIAHHGKIEITTQYFDAFLSENSYVVIAPDRTDDLVKISISDTGCGIPIGNYNSIFDPFYTTKDKQDGTGLGLSQLYSFVSNAKLGLSVSSTEGEGTTFDLWIPRCSRLPTAAVSQEHTVANLQGMNIVVIDDEPLLAELNEIYLTSQGASVNSFTSPVDGLDFIKKGADQIDIVVTDLYMPGELQGHDIADYLLSREPNIKCLILTGNVSAPELEGSKYISLGKPVKLEVLKETIFRICQ